MDSTVLARLRTAAVAQKCPSADSACREETPRGETGLVDAKFVPDHQYRVAEEQEMIRLVENRFCVKATELISVGFT